MVKKKKKKLGLTSLFTTTSSSIKKQVSDSTTASSSASMSSASSSSSSWQWPSCKQPRTLSFRQQQQHTTLQQAAYKTMNSAYLPDSAAASCFSTNSFDNDSLSTAAAEEASGLVDADEAEAVLRALRSDRLFFEPRALSPATTPSSILTKASKLKVKAVTDDKDTCSGSIVRDKTAAFQGATAMTMESSNPYRDFRASMEEMVTKSEGVKDWPWLEEMLGWYLRANGKSTHGLIVGAFVDLLVALSDDTTASPSSPTNCSSSCCSACSSSSLAGGGRGNDDVNCDRGRRRRQSSTRGLDQVASNFTE